MVVINGVSAKEIIDSRKEKTIEITIKTKAGSFSSSSPSGKSTGKYEKKIYKKSLEEDIETLNKFKEYFAQEIIDEFNDLKRIEDILEGNVGANTIFAFESAVLKAVAKEKKKQVWELINPKAKKMPRLVGNCIGGGKHSQTTGKKPDFQEFLLIPNKKTVKENYESNKATKEKVQYLLKDKDEKFSGKKNDENAWMTTLNDKEVLDVLSSSKIP